MKHSREILPGKPPQSAALLPLTIRNKSFDSATTTVIDGGSLVSY